MKPWYAQVLPENEDDRHMARMLSRIMTATLALSVVGFGTALYWDAPAVAAVTAVAVVLQVVPLFLLRRAHLHAASWVFIVLVLGLVTANATVAQGIHGYVLLGYPIVIVFAGLTVPGVGFKWSVVLTVACICWLVLGERGGWIVPQPGLPAGWVDLGLLVAITLVAALSVNFLAGTMRRNLDRARQELTERTRTEQELAQSHDLLTNLARLVPSVIYQYRLYPDGRSAFPYSSSA